MFNIQYIDKVVQIKGFNSIYYFEFGKDFSHVPEKHNFWEMVYVDAGRVKATANGRTSTLEQGHVIFHEPMEIHTHASDKCVSNNMLVICFTAKGEIMDYFKHKTFILDKQCKTLLSLFLQEAENTLGSIPSNYNDKSNIEFNENVLGGSQLLECYLTEFLIKLIRNGKENSSRIITKNERNISNNSVCELVCDYLKSNLHNNITLDKLCKNFMIGKTHLCNIFKEETGKSPIEYYNNLKINEAKKLLREKNYSVSDISDILGYSCVHNFSRAFKKSVGFSPRDYSKKIYK